MVRFMKRAFGVFKNPLLRRDKEASVVYDSPGDVRHDFKTGRYEHPNLPGDNDSDPIFMISDLLVHLSRQQWRRVGRAVPARDAEYHVGSLPKKKAKSRKGTW